MRIKNFTPHPITLRLPSGRDVVLQPEGLARVDQSAIESGVFLIGNEALPVSQTVFHHISGLPDPEDGTIIVTSAIVAEHAARAGRKDVFAPGTGALDNCVRDEKGRILAVTRLVTFSDR